MPLGNGAAPPPPPPGASKTFTPEEKHRTKLKRSSQMGDSCKVEGFPQKKLEALRNSSCPSSKLNGETLTPWERNKMKNPRNFKKSQPIDFDFHYSCNQIKESMVDVSSSCMELALKERRQNKSSRD
ncbi:hypothetical protein NC651_009810 [Populus alba x Populus x berolinensis]|nr:hypothetical protein NC651_009810 [Populus alba x Populus x berolinensis]